MGINRDAVKRKSKRRVKKTIEKVYKDVLEEGNKSEQDKKTYLIGIINEVTKIMQKSDNKKLRIIKKDTGKAVADDDQEGEGKMNIILHAGIGCFEEDELAKARILV